jgi:hypothetical protein
VGLLAVACVELLRIGLKHRRPFTPEERRAVRRLLPLIFGASALLGAGAAVGGIGGEYLGAVLVDPSNASLAGSVSPVLWVAGALLASGLFLWTVHRVLYRRARGRAGPAPELPDAYAAWPTTGYVPEAPVPPGGTWAPVPVPPGAPQDVP